MTEEEIITKLDNRKGEILYALCEDERINHPQVLVSLIAELRAIIRLKKEIEK